MHATCSVNNGPFAALIRCARIAPMYFIAFSIVKVGPFSISVASEVKGSFPLMVQLVLDALQFSPRAPRGIVRGSGCHKFKNV